MRAEGFFCNLDVLYGGLGIGKLQFLIQKKNLIFFSAVIFFQFLVIKALDPDWIRIGIQPKMLDPDPDEMNADPQPCSGGRGRGQAGQHTGEAGPEGYSQPGGKSERGWTEV